MIERIDRYIIKERIGIGGQSTVYLATDSELNRDVAIKVPQMMATVKTTCSNEFNWGFESPINTFTEPLSDNIYNKAW